MTKANEIYITLDALLDTRIGTLEKIDPELPLKVLSNNYYERTDDFFEGVDSTVFQELYAKRDLETLSKSVLTNAIKLVNDIVVNRLNESKTDSYVKDLKVVVNVYPYELDKETMIDIREAIVHWTEHLVPIELVSIPVAELTPIYCKTHFIAMIDYEYNNWLETHAEAFKTTRVSEIPFIAPALFYQKTPSEQELIAICKSGGHPFIAIEFMVSVFVKLTLVDVKYFSIIEKET